MLIKNERYMNAYIVSIQPPQDKGVKSELTLETWSKALSQGTTIHLYQSLLQVLLKCKFYSLSLNLVNQICDGALEYPR